MPQFKVELTDPVNHAMPPSSGILEAQDAEDAARKGLTRAWEAVQRTTGKTFSRMGWPAVQVTRPGQRGVWRFALEWTTGQPRLVQNQPSHGGFGGSV